MRLTFQKNPREPSKAGQFSFSIPEKIKKWPKNAAAQMHQIRQIAYVQVRKSKTAVTQH